jgi:hypothetical protein
MSVSSTQGILKTMDGETKDIGTVMSSQIDLNDILADLNLIKSVVNNLAIVLSVYLEQRGELDPKRFRLVAKPEEEQETQGS